MGVIYPISCYILGYFLYDFTFTVPYLIINCFVAVVSSLTEPFQVIYNSSNFACFNVSSLTLLVIDTRK